ncbi:hypothetical protein [Peribacillus frigoritolerans]|uniref:hypothetical protein n=1 Tax=Peribacillus frigoritolerans TaxID=450367 RepID=UPI0038097D54
MIMKQSKKVMEKGRAGTTMASFFNVTQGRFHQLEEGGEYKCIRLAIIILLYYPLSGTPPLLKALLLIERGFLFWDLLNDFC